jgi:nitrogen fixation NifU-like protein
LSEVGLPGYSATAFDHIRHPRNVGRLDDANGFGEIDDQATENYVSIYLRIESGRIVAARFRTLGCSSCVAASSATTELVLGQTPDSAAAVDRAAILTALDGLPPGKHHCADLAAAALARALADYQAGGRG